MKKLYYVIVLAILILLDLSSFAQKSIEKVRQSGPATVNLKITNYQNVPDTMTLLLMTDPLKLADGDSYTAIRDKYNQFTFHLPALKAPARIFFKTIIRPNIRQDYWIEPNDNVLLDITAEGKNALVRATGNGNGKFRYSLYIDSFYRANVRTGEDGPYNAELLSDEILRTDKSYSTGIDMLSRHKAYITPDMFKILQAELAGKNIRAKWTYVSLYRAAAPSDTGIIRRVLELEKEKVIDTVAREIAIQSTNYIFGQKLAAIMYIRAKYHGKNSLIAQTYDYLRTKYTGILREYLITSYLIDRPKGDAEDFKDTLKNAVSFISDKGLKARLQEILVALTYNVSAYRHFFIDPEGKNRTLAEWKGKVILLDFWFNGCVHCRHYSKVFEEKILPVFKDNGEVIFIGMNTDRDKNKWLDGIRSKEYTSDATINLSTLGQGFSHPFPKMFNVMSAPILFLIGKDGQLITANLSKDADQIIKQINVALKK